ncbi:cryptochrome/photolyase family protein [Chitinimonas taiwanensis]|uniref:Deoxyribodipyrimidine photolyase-related protein n=1 Tax=Chitinimonas taiwanensis DSM 18899 TaxID=1121279 RepID=A0A1K2HKK9_9NEIS|nr:cryptochrome/photolyase family protein [Chitinimonas taiwanensis]SFZ77319.1 deoxyribodipyrimidine photolyase-related protein [Chitinimonas taiwanensis DSM 18899]
MSTLRLILGDQLNAGHSWLRERRDDVIYLLMEVRSETDYVRHHAQKVLAIFAAMRGFAAALQAAGHHVHYLRIGDPHNRQSLAANLAQVANELGIQRIERIEADEYRVEQALDQAIAALDLPNQTVSAEHFLLERSEIAAQFASKVPRMATFYRAMRLRFRLLLDAAGEPVGGQWSYDADNREKWSGTPAAPAWPNTRHDLRALWAEIQAAGVQTLGEPSAEAFPWPLSRREARLWLAHFIEYALPHFGRFQDALSRESRTLFHSGLSFALNVKLLHPLEVIQAALAAFEAGKVPLADIEGFVRQILGWREFVRGVYWARMPGYAQLNALNAQRPLPSWYWSGDTQMACLQQAIRQSLDSAYAHHIQRLMVTGNFALLAGCAPDEVDAWYLGIYIDAFEWVELPNTRGMSQFADGGLLGSKPYCGSASYMQRQGDYCRGCHYDAKRRHGERACPLNSLYWHFHLRHADSLGRNPRLAMPYKAWSRMDETERSATLAQAEHYLARLDTL